MRYGGLIVVASFALGGWVSGMAASTVISGLIIGIVIALAFALRPAAAG